MVGILFIPHYYSCLKIGSVPTVKKTHKNINESCMVLELIALTSNSLIALVSYIPPYHWPHDSIHSTSKWDEQWQMPKEVIFIFLGH